MKQLWQVVLAMVRCWSVLLSLKLVNGFEDVVTSLERRTLGPLQLEYRLPPGSMGAAPDDDGGQSPDRRVSCVVLSSWCE
jgi:hypothetical protein